MIYDIDLKIAHRYQQPAGPSRHLIRVTPRGDAGAQRLTAHRLEVTPRPDEQFEMADFFGNRFTSVAHFGAHSAMVIGLTCRVEVAVPPAFLDVSSSGMALARELAQCSDLGPASPMHFIGPSPRLRDSSEIEAFARAAVDPKGSVAQQVIRLGEALHAEMTFDAQATTVETDPLDAFRLRGGVCQDFTHIMILGLRALGIPAGYVSGYLRTLPPKGAPRLDGADAMHAWVRAWCGAAQGWIEYDPTNATLASADHIVAGYGRDYADVSPVIGHLRASGGQVNTQSVDVRPVE